MIRFRLGWLAAAVLCLASASARAEPVSVVASFSILGDVVERVGAQHVRVQSLVGPDQDAHVFQPRPSDVAAVGKAQLVVINGLGFEGWIARLIQAAGYRGPVALATEGVPARGLAPGAHAHGDAGDDHGHDDHDHDHAPAAGSATGTPDPHAWQNPLNVARYAHNIAGALSVLEPALAAEFQANARAYETELRALDAWIAQRIESVPQARRVVITTHDAMGYYADRYHVKFVPAQGINTASEPSARQVANLVRQVRAEGVSALFVENMASDTVLRQIAAETSVAIGGRLYSDALSAPAGEAPDYITMMRRNTEHLVTAMQAGGQ
ncbi:metal ABC transporter substrate-binding protein [Verticiella sediminum]|uniref:Metal ABC transporter substrate-binding protein n=1 Tax=Verticiella sediminum TaxID=1247510 RepID=A0A556AYH2_9BURK|nr:zinc ABC transporter substrate-binding protein [Verticiella sediminum]TSH97989.1 metal ABC transporter substrate-binding protein [Verticiella sediminum]